MEERDWTILLNLYEKRSITKTAQALFISQPALTARLHQIEQRFDVKVVIRSRQGLFFTPEGKILVEYAQKILREIHFVEGRLKNSKSEISGTLRIGASNFFTRHKLPELLSLFRKQYPAVDFNVITNQSGNIVNLMHDHDVDIAFIRGEYTWSEKRELLFTEKMFAVSAQPFQMEDLTTMTQVDYISNKAVRDLIDHWWRENFAKPPIIGMKVDRVDSCKEMVLKGLGYAFLPDGMLDIDDKIYTVAMLNKTGDPLIRRTWMFYHEDVLKIALVKRFVDFVNGVDIYAL